MRKNSSDAAIRNYSSIPDEYIQNDAGLVFIKDEKVVIFYIKDLQSTDDLDGDKVIDSEASYDKSNANTMMNEQSYKIYFVWLKMVYVMNPVFELDKRSATQIKDFSILFNPICSRIKNTMGDKISFDTTPETEKDPFLLIDTHFSSCQLAVSKQLRLLLEVIFDLIDTPIQQGDHVNESDSDAEVLILQRNLINKINIEYII